MKQYKTTQNYTLSGSFVGDPFDVSDVNDVGIQIDVTTSANTGQFGIQASNDPTSTTWFDVTLSPVIPALAGANTTIACSLVDIPFNWVRTKFTIGTGTNGSAIARFFAKEV